uniref:Ion transport domain-containing protein n=1 Tax=Arcella intermedia TaxID=1963864 RepID=A0A6B2L8Z2_9EUKA
MLYRILDDPSFSQTSYIYSVINFISIVVSTVLFLVSTLPENHDSSPLAYEIIEIVVISLFTFDYFSRLILTRQNRIIFSLHFMNLVDLFSILPFLIEGVLGFSSVSHIVILRVLRLFRVVRLLKFARYFKELPVIVRALKASGAGFSLAVFFIISFVIFWATLVYYAELNSCQFDESDSLWKYDDGRPTPFQSIPHSLWWTVVTMTTVGYGDQVPYTTLGKIVGSGTMISGLFSIAFPLTILAGNFGSEYKKLRIEREIKDEKRLRRQRKENVTYLSSPKVLLQEIWGELLVLRGELQNSKKVLDDFERQFKKINLYVTQLERAMAKQNQDRKKPK